MKLKPSKLFNYVITLGIVSLAGAGSVPTGIGGPVTVLVFSTETVFALVLARYASTRIWASQGCAVQQQASRPAGDSPAKGIRSMEAHSIAFHRAGAAP
jgi:hypothetical protein